MSTNGSSNCHTEPRQCSQHCATTEEEEEGKVILKVMRDVTRYLSTRCMTCTDLTAWFMCVCVWMLDKELMKWLKDDCWKHYPLRKVQCGNILQFSLLFFNPPGCSCLQLSHSEYLAQGHVDILSVMSTCVTEGTVWFFYCPLPQLSQSSWHTGPGWSWGGRGLWLAERPVNESIKRPHLVW